MGHNILIICYKIILLHLNYIFFKGSKKPSLVHNVQEIKWQIGNCFICLKLIMLA